jgi:hypothetical protein
VSQVEAVVVLQRAAWRRANVGIERVAERRAVVEGVAG